MNWSSIGMLAVISRVDEEILMMRGGSDVAWERAHSLTALSSDAIILGDIWGISLVMESWTWGDTFFDDVEWEEGDKRISRSKLLLQ